MQMMNCVIIIVVLLLLTLFRWIVQAMKRERQRMGDDKVGGAHDHWCCYCFVVVFVVFPVECVPHVSLRCHAAAGQSLA